MHFIKSKRLQRCVVRVNTATIHKLLFYKQWRHGRLYLTQPGPPGCSLDPDSSETAPPHDAETRPTGR